MGNEGPSRLARVGVMERSQAAIRDLKAGSVGSRLDGAVGRHLMLPRVWGCEPLPGRGREGAGQGRGQEGIISPSLLMGESPLPLPQLY